MLRLTGILVWFLTLAPALVSQVVPKELLSIPTRLELNKPTTEVKAGTTVSYTVTLKNAQDQAVAAPSNLQLEIETPTGQKTVMVPAGQSSANFTWQAQNSGVGRMTVRSGTLHPASGLVLVAPSPKAELLMAPLSHPVAAIAEMARTPQAPPPPPQHHLGMGGAAGMRTAGGAAKATAGGQSPPPPPPAPVAAPSPAPATALGQAKTIQLFVDPASVYPKGPNQWAAKISIAAMNQDALVPVSTDVPIHFTTTSGQLSPSDIVLPAGQLSNFEHPVQLTSDHYGKTAVNAVSSLGMAGPAEVDYLQPLPSQLRLSVTTPVLAGTGSSTVNVEVCLLDESGAVTSSDQDMQVTLTASGQLASPTLPIPHGSYCSSPMVWTSTSGPAHIRAEAVGLKADTQNLVFPSFPWYFVWLAAGGGLLGALVSSSGDLFSARWWSHTWRGLVLGAILGALFYLFARFGAIALPMNSPVNIQNIPVVSGVGALLLGFLGGLYGRKFWQKEDDKPQPPAPPIARGAAGGAEGGGD